MSERPSSERSSNKHMLLRPWEKPPQKVNKSELAGLVNAELYALATAEDEDPTFAKLNQASSQAIGVSEQMKASEKRLYTRTIATLSVALISLMSDLVQMDIELNGEFIAGLAIVYTLYEIFVYFKHFPQLRNVFDQAYYKFRHAIPQESYLAEYRHQHGTRIAIAKVREIKVMVEAQAAALQRLEKPKRNDGDVSEQVANLQLPPEFDTDGMKESLRRLMENPGSDGADINSFDRPNIL